MSNREKTRIPRAATDSRAEDTKCLLLRSQEPRTEKRQAARDENYTQERAKLPTNMYMEREYTFHAVADAVVSKYKQATFEQGPVAPLKSD